MRPISFALLATLMAMASGPAPSLAGPQARINDTTTTTVTTAAPRREAVLSVVPTNPKLVSKLQAMLPRGTTVQEAAAGFMDQTTFVAAVQLAHNLRIPFDDMRSLIVDEGMSVGQAVQHHRPDVDVGHELRRARRMAQSER